MKSTMRLGLQGALFLGGVLGGVLFAQTPLLKVEVKDAGGLAISKATVRARHQVSGAGNSCQTDADGACSLATPLKGEYRVTASYDKLTDASAVFFSSGSGGTMSLRLQPGAVISSVTVVSGSRTEELQDESVVKVDAVTREQMQSTGYERVSDVLSEIPGVLVRRGSTAGTGGEQIQGVDSRQVAVLQDGLPVIGARGIKSGALNLNRQTSDRLARVEVAKGAGSPLYGSDAIGGVINMITREPVNTFESNVMLSGGSLGTMDLRGDIGGRVKNLMYFLNVGTNRMDSYGLIPSSPNTVGPDIRRNDGLFKTRYHFTPQFALGFTANAYHNKETGRTLQASGLTEGLANDSVQTYAVVADWTISPSTILQARGYSARYDENGRTTILNTAQTPALSNLNERLKRLDATISHQAGSKHLISGGVEWAQNLYKGANRIVGDNAGQQVTTADYWVQDKWTMTSRLTAHIGGRITEHSLFGNAAVPKVGLIYRLSDSWMLRGSWGMGFRAPDLGQLYFRFANPASFYQVIGNPTLKPEHSNSYQAGVVFRRANYRLGLTLYRHNIRDLIDSINVGTPTSLPQLEVLMAQYGIPMNFQPFVGRQTFIYLNQARIYTQGFEVDGEYAIQRNLRVSGAYTFLQPKDRISGLELTQRHRHNSFVRADYIIPKLGLSTNIRGAFYSGWFLNAAAGTRGLGYQIWDAYASKSMGARTQLFVSVDNLNDSRDGKLSYATPSFDRPDYGRTFRGGIRMRLGKLE